MIRKKTLPEQDEFWVPRDSIRAGRGKTFYDRLADDLDKEGFGDFVRELCAPYYHDEAGGRPPIDPEDKAAVAEFDRKRKGRKTSNAEWVSPNDPDASIGPRKDGAWDMIHKVENAVDMDSGAILSCEIQSATKADSTGMAAHIETAGDMVDHVAAQVDEPTATLPADRDAEHDAEAIEEDIEDDASQKRYAVGDKGYHKNAELAELVAAGIEPVIAEPAGRAPSKSDEEQAKAFATNRTNRKTDMGRELMRTRAEKVERSFQHQLDHGGARRTTLTGHENIGKRLLISAFTFNLAIYGRNVYGFGTVKQYQAGNRWIDPLFALVRGILRLFKRSRSPLRPKSDRSPIRALFSPNDPRPILASHFRHGLPLRG